mmetsp:Transcript_41971/g.48678  ORF Transcript_41971/g.48678 Transcript_41971/m.48678 type:complete len:223 (+) Transcript_41971:43-711(+)
MYASMRASGYRPSANTNEAETTATIAKRIFGTYDKNKNGEIDLSEIAPMLQDTYRAMNRTLLPSKLDIDSFHRILDRDGNGKVTLEDIQALCNKYLTGDYARVGRYSYREQNELRKSGLIGGEGQATEEQKQAGSSIAQNYLDQARTSFNKYDESRTGYVEKIRLGALLEDTFKAIGITKVFTNEEVYNFAQTLDPYETGKFTLTIYEKLVLKTLEEAGVKL